MPGVPTLLSLRYDATRSEIYHIVNFALLSNMTVAKENIVLLRQTQRKPGGDTSPIFYADKILN